MFGRRRAGPEPLDSFLESYLVTAGQPRSEVSSGLSPLGQLQARFGGCTFNRGVYRVHTEQSAQEATAWVDAAFPEFAGLLFCFGYSWLGDQFAIDTRRGEAEDGEVMLLDPGAGEALEIPVRFSVFHDTELVSDPEATLSVSMFSEWRSIAHKLSIGPKECAGYRVPLFLGGQDVVGNLELTDIEVYWHFAGQLISQTRNVPPGTTVHVDGPTPPS